MADNQLTGVNIDETHGTELSANFYVHFQTRKNEIATKLENVKISGKTLGPSHPDIISISSDIANLRRDLIEATPHLPAYDQGKCEQQLKTFEESFSQMRAPRTKFTFKRNPGAAVGSKTGQLQTSKNLEMEVTGNNNSSSSSVPSVSTVAINYSPPTSNLTLSSRKSEELTIWSLMGSDKIVDLPDSSDVTLDHLHNCFVNFFPSKDTPSPSVQTSFRITALHGRDLNRTILLIPPIDGSVLLHNIHNSIIILACRQFRIHDSTNTTILLDVFSNPIIERSNNLRFGTFPEELKYALSAAFTNVMSCINHFFKHGLSLAADKIPQRQSSTQYSVQDFDWIKPTHSPNWSQIEPPYHFVNKILRVFSRDPGGVQDYDVTSLLTDCIN